MRRWIGLGVVAVTLALAMVFAPRSSKTELDGGASSMSVVSDEAFLFEKPNADRAIRWRLPIGERVFLHPPEQNGMVQVSTSASGEKWGWIDQKYLKAATDEPLGSGSSEVTALEKMDPTLRADLTETTPSGKADLLRSLNEVQEGDPAEDGRGVPESNVEEPSVVVATTNSCGNLSAILGETAGTREEVIRQQLRKLERKVAYGNEPLTQDELIFLFEKSHPAEKLRDPYAKYQKESFLFQKALDDFAQKEFNPRFPVFTSGASKELSVQEVHLKDLSNVAGMRSGLHYCIPEFFGALIVYPPHFLSRDTGAFPKPCEHQKNETVHQATWTEAEVCFGLFDGDPEASVKSMATHTANYGYLFVPLLTLRMERATGPTEPTIPIRFSWDENYQAVIQFEGNRAESNEQANEIKWNELTRFPLPDGGC